VNDLLHAARERQALRLERRAARHVSGRSEPLRKAA
jgi:hypothetical protein